jgi:hypothetical protein
MSEWSTLRYRRPGTWEFQTPGSSSLDKSCTKISLCFSCLLVVDNTQPRITSESSSRMRKRFSDFGGWISSLNFYVKSHLLFCIHHLYSTFNVFACKSCFGACFYIASDWGKIRPTWMRLQVNSDRCIPLKTADCGRGALAALPPTLDCRGLLGRLYFSWHCTSVAFHLNSGRNKEVNVRKWVERQEQGHSRRSSKA